MIEVRKKLALRIMPCLRSTARSLRPPTCVGGSYRFRCPELEGHGLSRPGNDGHMTSIRYTTFLRASPPDAFVAEIAEAFQRSEKRIGTEHLKKGLTLQGDG